METFEKAKQLDEPVFIMCSPPRARGTNRRKNGPTPSMAQALRHCHREEIQQSPGARHLYQSVQRCLVELGEKNRKVVAITAAMPEGTGLDVFGKYYPDRFFDVGIAEQHGVTMGAGLAANGYHPLVALYSTFAQRAFDQLLHDVAMQNLPLPCAWTGPVWWGTTAAPITGPMTCPISG